MQFFLGLGVVLATVFGGYLLAKGNLATFWQPAEYIIILGAATGALIIGNSKPVLMEMLHQAKAVLKGKSDEEASAKELMIMMYSLLSAIQQGSLKSLDSHIENPQDSAILKRFPAIFNEPIVLNFIIDNFRTLSMEKYAPHEFDAVMEKEIIAIETDLLKPSKSLHKTAEAMPGFGILAAVGGIIITMQYLDGPLAQIGYKVSAALVGTFIGIFFCYALLEPLASAMHERCHKTITLLEAVKAMLVTMQEGKGPLVSVDAGRRVLEMEVKPSFMAMEKMVKEADISKEIVNNK